jgi:hypothetical protein
MSKFLGTASARSMMMTRKNHEPEQVRRSGPQKEEDQYYIVHMRMKM